MRTLLSASPALPAIIKVKVVTADEASSVADMSVRAPFMIHLSIVTPERKVLDAEVDSVTVPTASGEAGLLTNHAPVVSALRPGILSYSVKGSVEKMVVAGGFVEMNNNKVSVLTDSAETATEIDIEAARAARETAERELAANASSAVELTEVTREQLEAANARIQLAAGK